MCVVLLDAQPQASKDSEKFGVFHSGDFLYSATSRSAVWSVPCASSSWISTRDLQTGPLQSRQECCFGQNMVLKQN